MAKRATVRRIILLVILLFFGYIIADALRVFDDRPYNEIPHGNHSHYVPKDCTGDIETGQFPTQPPGPGERIDCSGRIVPVEQ